MQHAQHTYMAWLAGGKSEEDKTWARANDSATHAELKNAVRTDPANGVCADCSAIRPGWAVLPHGAYVCIDCAQLHRGLGRHISQVKAFNTGTYLWFLPELEVMRTMGNARVNETHCASPDAPPKPSQHADASTKLAYVRNKYEHRLWATSTPAAMPSPPAQEDFAVEATQARRMLSARETHLPAAPEFHILQPVAYSGASVDLLSAPVADGGFSVPLQPTAHPPHPFFGASWTGENASDAHQSKATAVLSSYTSPPEAMAGISHHHRRGQPAVPQALVQGGDFFSQYGL
mmetsp:Transcript_2161/g.5456  ORF Transcript_2161/g.5456 Transcript_2161/m.5456 type:complete len:290 (-) Transcript_2161:433-1302(-)